ncbi:MAG: malonyl-ACP O-methyltransferase BioC [Desulfobulbaceae bacterium]|nr:malonyl-ACP O-methyltransferase BioC [Desulfobulbaceae bacterium]
MTLNKDRIKKRFSRAAATYDDQAFIQLKVADRLLSLLDKYTAGCPGKVLEIGCCTGLLTSRLAQRCQDLEKLYVNDLVAEFRPLVAGRVPAEVNLEFLEGDIETVALPADIDLVISSSTFHWLHDLSSLFARLAAHMAPNSILAFSMYSNRNLHEIREITGIGLDYYGPAEIKALVEEYFRVQTFEEEVITFRFRDPLDILHHLRETGVNALDGSPWNRSRLADFIAEYKHRFGDGDRVRLTYHPVYCVACRKDK